MAAELAEALPENAVLVNESVSNTVPFLNLVQFRDPLAYRVGKGGGRGHSMPAAMGIKLGAPDRHQPEPERAVRGAEQDQLPHPQAGANGMGGPWGPPGTYPPGLDIGGPDVDFAALARSFGLAGERVTDPRELRAAVQRGLGAGRPCLLEVVLEKEV